MTAATARPLSPLRLASAGVAMVGVTFGMARYGFGLLAPDVRDSFALSSSSLGALSAASYAAYIAATVVAGVASGRLGPRALVGAGGACAVAGMLIAGTAASPAMLFAGLLIAGASAGLVFPPFADVVPRSLRESVRPRVLAAVNAGTGWGVALAAPVALLAGSSWRMAWLLFAGVAALATAWALSVLPGGGGGDTEPPRLRPRWFVCPRSGPLLAAALLVGVASSAYWTFAVDLVVNEGGLSTTTSRLFLALVGLASIAGTVAGDALQRLGVRAVLVIAALGEAAALATLGLAPGVVPAVFASALLFGSAYNVLVAVQVLWSGEVFAERPAAGLAGVMTMNAAGLLVGPPLLGALADAAGFAAAFALAAGIVVCVIALQPCRSAREASP